MNVHIRECGQGDLSAILEVINEAARWYREIVPPHEYREPEMTREELQEEAKRVRFFGAFTEEGRVVGVMGLEYVQDVALIRHGYVLPKYQRQRIGTALLCHIESLITGAKRVIAGTYAMNYRARGFLEQHGYHIALDSDEVLHRYYTIPEGRRTTSVAYEKRRIHFS